MLRLLEEPTARAGQFLATTAYLAWFARRRPFDCEAGPTPMNCGTRPSRHLSHAARALTGAPDLADEADAHCDHGRWAWSGEDAGKLPRVLCMMRKVPEVGRDGLSNMLNLISNTCVCCRTRLRYSSTSASQPSLRSASRIIHTLSYASSPDRYEEATGRESLDARSSNVMHRG
jgi:hypothetical protein